MRHAHESIAKSIASTRLAAPKRIVVGWRRSLGKGLSFRYYLRNYPYMYRTRRNFLRQAKLSNSSSQGLHRHVEGQ